MAPRVAVTMSGPWPGPVDIVRPLDSSPLRFLRQFMPLAAKADVVIVLGSCGARQMYCELVAALLLKLRRRRPVVLVHDATWDVSSDFLERRLAKFSKLVPGLVRLAIKSIDGPNVQYGVLSTDEERSFASLWNIDAKRVHFVPFCATISTQTAARASDGGYIFAGGNSYRDYEVLVRAVDGLEVPVIIASSWRPAEPLPSNVTCALLPHAEYVERFLSAGVVVVPLRRAVRSAGQQTYLGAMLMGKPVIVTDAPGVRDYIQDGETGLIVDPRPESIREAIQWVTRPANRAEVEKMTEKAKAIVEERFLMRDYFAGLWDLSLSALPGD
jgi:glycosyltransferase involved in cell wall biosynthesis